MLPKCPFNFCGHISACIRHCWAAGQMQTGWTGSWVHRGGQAGR